MPAQRTTTSISKGDGRGLSAAEAQARLKQFGPNAVVEEKTHPARELVRKFWAPVPWLLEATITIQIFLGEVVEASVIGGLLIFNAVLSFLQESHTKKVLELLKQQLRVQARVRRDGAWMTEAAEELVPGDVIHLRQGGIVPADVRIDEGSLLLDLSALTGESAAVSVEAEKLALEPHLVLAATCGEGTYGTGVFTIDTDKSVRLGQASL